MTTDGPDPIEELKTLVNDPPPAQPQMVIVPGTPAKEKTPRMVSNPELAAYLLSALCVIAMVILTLHGDEVPQTLDLLAVGALGVGGAITQAPGAGK